VIAFACILASAVTLYYVFHLPELVTEAPEKTRATFLRERKEAVYENLRDLNFEFKAGKLPETDYQSMATALEDEAAGILAEIEQLESSVPLASRNKKGHRA
jgi:hypothetical protein